MYIVLIKCNTLYSDNVCPHFFQRSSRVVTTMATVTDTVEERISSPVVALQVNGLL